MIYHSLPFNRRIILSILVMGADQMKIIDVLEYCNVAVWFDRSTLLALLQALVEAGLNVAWKESQQKFQVKVYTGEGVSELNLHRVNGTYRLHEADYSAHDIRLALVLYHFIGQAKGHAVVKIVNEGKVFVKNIRYGEAVRIVEIKGAERKVIYEKACSVTMDQVIAALKRKDAEERIPVLRLELDYELATLYDAIQMQDKLQIRKSKERLQQLRREMLLLEA